MNNGTINIRSFQNSHIMGQEVELVERKGLGHPDYIADSTSEELSRRLSKYYLEEFGVILHHNVDKTLLVGGQARPEWADGEVLNPILIIHAGRATNQVTYDGKVRTVPVARLAVESTKDWISENMRYLDPERHVIVDHKINPGSTDLVSLFDKGKHAVPLSNDTSFGVGFAPLTPLEQTVLNIEKTLNSREFKHRVPEVGEDIKVMGLRRRDKYIVTIAAAVVSGLTSGIEHYNQVKAKIEEEARRVGKIYLKTDDIEVNVNTADKGAEQVYLTVTGTSAEHGDDGAVGRGNRSNGLITPNRPMSLEAVAGKNPVSHVGKIYNLVSQQIADQIVKELGVGEVYVKMLSQIGRPVDAPLQVDVQFLSTEQSPASMYSHARSIVEQETANISKVTEKLLSGQLKVC
ncbi:MAG: methionine adenosyltransferase [Thermoprotei archaeon]